MPDHPGLYTLTYDGGTEVEKIFSVNPSPKESELVYADSPDAVNVWRLNTAPGAKRSVAAAAQLKISLRGILQQRLWWWMLLGGLLALVLEMALAEGRRERS